MRTFLVTYLVDGIKDVVEVEARNEYEARENFYNYVNFRPSYVDHAILSVETWELYEELTELFGA